MPPNSPSFAATPAVLETEPGHLLPLEETGQRPPHSRLDDGSHDIGLDGRGLHPRRTGDGLGPGRQVDLGDARLGQDAPAPVEGQEPVVRIVVDEVQPFAAFSGAVSRLALPLVERGQDRPDDRRRLAALGDTDDDVAFADASVMELQAADELEVLEALEGADQGPVRPGHLADEGLLDTLRNAAGELRRDLPVRLHPLPKGTPERALHLLGQPARGAATVYIDLPAAEDGVLDGPGGLLEDRGRRRQFLQFRPDIVVDRGQHLQAGQRVLLDALAEGPRFLMALLREQGVELELRFRPEVIDGFRGRLDPEQLKKIPLCIPCFLRHPRRDQCHDSRNSRCRPAYPSEIVFLSL
jgi:hypothetical protein